MTHLLPMDMLQVALSAAAMCVVAAHILLALPRSKASPDTFPVAVLAAALCCTAVVEFFDLASIVQPERVFLWKKLAVFAEGLLPPFWLLSTFTLARNTTPRSLSLRQRFLLGLSLLLAAVPPFLPVGSLFYSPDFSQERMLFLGHWGFFFYLLILVQMVIALINLEVTFANASRPERWKVKFEILGVGLLLSALVFYYSQGLLYRTINMNLVPVRTVALLISIIFIRYSQQRRQGGVKIHISRNIACKSVVLMAVGFYLIGLGLVGEGMRYFGDSFQRSLVIALVFVTATGFITILLSETVKRKIRVFVSRNFYQNKYDYRAQWLEFTDRLSSAGTGDELLASILCAFCETFGMGGGALFLTGYASEEFFVAARLEMEPGQPRASGSDPFVQYLLSGKQVVNVRECAGDPVLANNDFLQKNHVSLAVPLFINGMMHGFILMVRPLNSNETYGTEDYDLMKTLAHQTSSAILNLRLSGQLAQAKELEVLGRVSTFVVHDLKNLLYSVSLILDNARDYITDPEFQQDMLASLGNTVEKMKALISKLKYRPEATGFHKEPVDLLRLMEDAASSLSGVGVRIAGSSVIAQVDKDEMHKVALNLLVNAADATGGRGTVSVEVGGEDQAFIRVTDNGCGIPGDFLQRDLFSPFKSTKKSGLGIGLYQCKQIVDLHNGRIEVESEVGKGSTFTVRLPLADR